MCDIIIQGLSILLLKARSHAERSGLEQKTFCSSFNTVRPYPVFRHQLVNSWCSRQCARRLTLRRLICKGSHPSVPYPPTLTFRARCSRLMILFIASLPCLHIQMNRPSLKIMRCEDEMVGDVFFRCCFSSFAGQYRTPFLICYGRSFFLLNSIFDYTWRH
jgi:hypothetical protein